MTEIREMFGEPQIGAIHLQADSPLPGYVGIGRLKGFDAPAHVDRTVPDLRFRAVLSYRRGLSHVRAVRAY